LVLLSLLIAAAAAIAWGWQRFLVEPVEFRESPIRFTVPSGANVRGIANTLRTQGVAVRPTELWLWYKLRGHDGKLKAGTYELAEPMTIDALLEKFVRGDVLMISIRFIEGWTFRQMREAIDANPELAHDTRGLDAAELMRRIGASETQPEGLFFPDTYPFSPGTSDIEIYRHAYQAMKRTLHAAWEARQPDL